MALKTIEEVLREQGFYIDTVKGDSMMPMLRQGIDTVRIVPVKGELKKYDVPLFKRPEGRYVLHRITKVKKNYYVICGDNRFLREKIPKSWIVGVLDGFYRGDTEISLSDEKYVRYCKRVERTFWSRRIRNKWKKITGQKGFQLKT